MYFQPQIHEFTEGRRLSLSWLNKKKLILDQSYKKDDRLMLTTKKTFLF